MELIFFLILFLILSLYVFFRLLKWVFTKKERFHWALALVGVLILSSIIKTVFFTKMEFIQSNVYPDLQLVKNPIRNRDSLNKLIKQKVLQKIDSQFIGNEEKFKQQFRPKNNPPETYLRFPLRFYEYTTGDNLLKQGTVWFIDHEEDPGGFSSDEFSDYEEYKIAEIDINFYKNDTLNYFGNLKYFQNGKLIKTDTVINIKH